MFGGTGPGQLCPGLTYGGVFGIRPGHFGQSLQGAETAQTTDAQHCDWVEQDSFMENACPVMPEK